MPETTNPAVEVSQPVASNIVQTDGDSSGVCASAKPGGPSERDTLQIPIDRRSDSQRPPLRTDRENTVEGANTDKTAAPNSGTAS